MNTFVSRRKPSDPRPIFYALAALVAIALTWAYLTPSDVAVRTRGIVRAKGDPIRIVSEVGGRIRSVHVREGSEVHQGDPLIQLETRDLLLKKKALESRAHFTELRLADLKGQLQEAASIEQQSASIDVLDRSAAQRNTVVAAENARVRFARSDSLVQEGLISRQAYDEARTALAQAEAEEFRLSSKAVELKRAQAEACLHDLSAGSTPLRAELAGLYHELEQTRFDLARLTITSPADGQITFLSPLHADGILSSGVVVAAVVPNAHSLVIESWLPTSDRVFVNVNQHVRLQNDAFPAEQDKAIDGTVVDISPDTRFDESVTGAYRVLIAPEAYSPPLRLGMVLQVNFITRQERLLWLLFRKIRRPFE